VLSIGLMNDPVTGTGTGNGRPDVVVDYVPTRPGFQHQLRSLVPGTIGSPRGSHRNYGFLLRGRWFYDEELIEVMF